MRDQEGINGIDFLEVVDREAEKKKLRQRLLRVYLLNVHSGDEFTADKVRIEGGERVKNIAVINVTMGVEDEDKVMTVEVDRPGDFSVYTLRLLRSDLDGDTGPPEDFDPMLATVEFSFKVECPSEFDCKPERICAPDKPSTPQIDYLSKDYASFRRLMLDRMAVLAPEWQERHAADLGITLVELLAHIGDHLSYEQDAIATEAYLGTARRRISARRHARLVDYFISDGSNARTWVQVQVSEDVLMNAPDEPVLPEHTQLFTGIQGQDVLLPEDESVLSKAALVFETMHELSELYLVHNEMKFYTWSDHRCCLPVGATHATLVGHFPDIRGRDEEHGIDGDVLVFEEKLGPETGNEADADPQRRHPVLLTKVDRTIDRVTDEQITDIDWSPEDALTFAFCVSSLVKQDDDIIAFDDVSVARGNIVLADHGRKVVEPPWEPVPEPRLNYVSKPATERCDPLDPKMIPVRFHPRLKEVPVTQAAPKPVLLKSARAAMQWQQRKVLPEIKLFAGDPENNTYWEPRLDLLNSDEDEEHFVAEIEYDSTVLRFGDDKRGKRPNAGTRFTPQYRVGNGVVGNIGVDSLVHILSGVQEISAVRNLTPGQGGSNPESIEDIRQRAPFAFRTQERAVTKEDYEDVTERHPDVQQVAATPRWTGSWYTWFLTVDRKGGLDVVQEFESEIRGHVERFRMAGYDLEVDGPRFVPLKIKMFVCVEPEFFRSDVKEALLAVFNNQRMADGRLGVFHPDNYTFGQTVYLSPLYARAQAVAGVASVQFNTFQRQRFSDPTALRTGKLLMDRLEIAQLDNDLNFPERGVFHLEMGGGK